MSTRSIRSARALLTVATAAGLVVALPNLAGAQAPAAPRTPKVTVVNSALAAPFNIATDRGRIWVADGGPAKVYRVLGSTLKVVASGPQPGDVAGVDVSRDGRSLAYTSVENVGGGTSGPPEVRNGKLTILGPHGRRVVANLARYEARRNPDHIIRYGIRNPSACVRQALGAQADYRGIVESHPYSVAAWGRSSWIVADAGANDLLLVNRAGHVRKLSVLPRQPAVITAAAAKAQGYPSCVVGLKYRFEAVPTDVEVGPGGWLYVTTLPGGPEDPSLGARGSVYRVNPYTGRATRIATGISGATNLALGPRGQIYVAEFFAGRISVIRNGKPHPYLTLPGVVSVESDGRGNLWAGTLGSEPSNGNPGKPGTLVKITR